MKKINRAEMKHFISFGIVGAVGTILNTAILYVLTTFAGMYYLLASAIAIEAAIISNFLGNHYITFKKSSHKTSVMKKFLLFQLISMVTLVLSLTILWLLTTTFGMKYLIILNLITIFTVFVVNFLLNRKFTWTHAEVHMDVAETG